MDRHTILYANPFSQLISGADESLLALLAGLDQQRFRPLVVLPGSSPLETRYQEVGAEVHHLPVHGLRRSALHLARTGLLFTPALLGLLRLMTRERVHLVHTNMSVLLQAPLASRLAGVPGVVHVRSLSIGEPAWACRLLVRALESSANHFIAVSDSIASLLYQHEARRPVSVIHDPVDVRAFAEVPPAGARDQLTIGTLGRINPRKGLESFIDAAAELRRRHAGLRFRIHGGAADEAEACYLEDLRARVRRLGLAEVVELPGPSRDVPGTMAELDLFLITSVSEGFGRVVVEAMAAGRPVVGMAVGGIQELVQDGETGFLVPPGDARALAAAVSRYVTDRSLLREHGQRARTLAQQYDIAVHARQVEAVYDHLLPGRSLTSSHR